MADVTITPSAVQQTSSTIYQDGTAGATIVAGQVVYQDSADSNEWKLADSSDVPKAAAKGLAMNGAANGQPLRVATGGRLTVDGFTALVFYYVSGTAGGLCPYADLGSGEYVTQVCAAISATEIEINPIALGVAVS